jgi:ABC-type transport system substrate-binding protein
VPQGAFGYNASVPVPTTNMTLAKQLLLSAGPSAGFSPSNPQTIPCIYGSGMSSAEAACAQLASNINGLQTGLVIAPTPLQFSQLVTQFFSKQLPLAFFGLLRPGDASFWLTDYGDGINGQLPPELGYNDSALNQVIGEQQASTNQTQRLALISQADNMINNDYAYVWAYQNLDFFPTTSNVQNVVINPNFALYYFASMT